MFVLFAAACATPDKDANSIVIEHTDFEPSNVRALIGSNWPTASGSVVSPDSQGNFSAPGRARSVVAFVDADGDGAFDRTHEPMVHCRLESARRWRCPLTRMRIAAHRVVVKRFADGRVAPVGDQLAIYAQRFLPVGSPESGVRICLRNDRDVCAANVATPFDAVAGMEQAIPPCQLESKVKKGDPIALTVTSQDASELLEIRYPPDLELEVTTASDASQYHVKGLAQLPITQAILWLGDSQGQVLWSSEQSPRSLSIEGRSLDATIPGERVSNCDGCKLMLQAAHVDDGPNIGSYSETRFIISTP